MVSKHLNKIKYESDILYNVPTISVNDDICVHKLN